MSNKKRTISILLVAVLIISGLPYCNTNQVLASSKFRCLNILARKGMYRNSTFVIRTNKNAKYVKYASRNRRIATVARSGKITARGVGSTIIVVRYGRQQKNIRLTVRNYKLSCTNILSSKTMYKNKRFLIKTNAGRRSLKYYSNNKTVAIVSSRGIITARQRGTAVISVKYGSQIKRIRLTVKISGQYNPSNVAKLANQKIKCIRNSLGEKMIYLPDEMNKALANGDITKEEYKQYYPHAGAGYFIMYYQTSLNTAMTIGGRRLKSENAIADAIKDFYSVSDIKQFYVGYAGTRKINGKYYYQFNLYRA